jgi:hypothetical protein
MVGVSEGVGGASVIIKLDTMHPIAKAVTPIPSIGRIILSVIHRLIAFPSSGIGGKEDALPASLTPGSTSPAKIYPPIVLS